MIAARCPKCNIIGSCICNFGKYELTKEEKDKWDKGVEEMNRQPIQFLNVWKETVNKPTISEFQLSAKEKGKYCEECGAKLKGNDSEIAHVLPKNYFKSVMCSDSNVLYLCGLYSDNNCHYNLDNFPQEKVREMKIFPKIQELYTQLKSEITEKLNYKLTERYDN